MNALRKLVVGLAMVSHDLFKVSPKRLARYFSLTARLGGAHLKFKIVQQLLQPPYPRRNTRFDTLVALVDGCLIFGKISPNLRSLDVRREVCSRTLAPDPGTAHQHVTPQSSPVWKRANIHL